MLVSLLFILLPGQHISFRISFPLFNSRADDASSGHVFSILHASNSQYRRGIPTPFSCVFLAAHSSAGSLLPIPIALADKVTKIMVHPLRKNIAFPVALHELL